MGRRRLLLIVALLALVAGLCVPAASAATGLTPLPTTPSSGSDPVFGAWLPDPSAKGSSVYYRSPYLTPVSNPNTPEIVNFSCNYPLSYVNAAGETVDMPKSMAGQPIKQSDVDAVVNNLTDARNYYYAVMQQGPSDDSASMNDWMQQLQKQNPAFNESNDPTHAVYSEQQAGYDLYLMTHFLASSPTLGSASNPIQQQVLYNPTSNVGGLTANIPDGCDLGAFQDVANTDNLGFHTLISKPWLFVASLVTYIIGSPIQWVYSEVEPYAFAYGFYTPHSERGDLIFNADFSCNPAPVSSTTSDANGKSEKQFTSDTVNNQTQQLNNDSCSAKYQPLGFSQQNLTSATSTQPKSTPAWLAWSIFFQWLISCTYFIILFGGAIIYMSRADHKSSYTIVQMMPKLVLSIILTIGLNFLIGAIISFGNYLVQAMFSLGDASAVNNMRDLFVAISNAEPTGDIAQTGLWFGANLLALGLMALSVFYLLRIVLFAIWRQIALLILIAIAPFATFCIIHPKLQHHFGRFARARAAIAIAPAAMAFILKLGVAVNPAISNQTPVNSDLGIVLLGSAVLLLTLHLMLRVPAMCKAIVKNRPVSEGATGKLGGLMKGLAPIAGVLGSPALGFAMAGAGAGLSGVGRAGQKTAVGMGSLIPDQKMRSTLSGPPKAGFLGRMAQSEFAGDLAGMAGAAAMEKGMASGGKTKLALEAGGMAGMADALRHGGTAALGVTGGALLGGMFRGNQRTQMHFKNFERRRYTEQGVRRVSQDFAHRLLYDQQEAVAEAQKSWNPEEHDGQQFDADKWLHNVYWKPTAQGGMGNQRVIRRGAIAGSNAAFFIAQDWSQHGSRPLTSTWSKAGHAPEAPLDEQASSGWQQAAGAAAFAEAEQPWDVDPEAEAYVRQGRDWQHGAPAGGTMPPPDSTPPGPPPPAPSGGPVRRRRGPAGPHYTGPQTPGYQPFNVYSMASDYYGREMLRLARSKASLSMEEVRDQVDKMTAGENFTEDAKQNLAEGLMHSLYSNGVLNGSGEVNQSAFNTNEGRDQMRQVDLYEDRDNSTVGGSSSADSY